MRVDGFIFLKDLFVGQNESQGKIVKYPALSKHKRRHVKLSDTDVAFEVKCDPEQLLNYQMIWKIVLDAENESVVSKSIGLLVNLHFTLHASIGDEQKSDIT